MDRPGLVTIFGASGFVGTQLVQSLARRGHRIRAAERRPDLANHLRPLGDVGQVVPVQANLRFADSVARAVEGAEIVINLVGIGFERGAQDFAAVHVEGARTVAMTAARAGARRLVHMSALGADPASPSAYARSKAAGEAAVLEAFPEAVLMRPSLIFGPGDSFFNLMASLARIKPMMPLIGGRTKFQPVYVGDVADAFAAAASGIGKGGRAYELGGPEVVTNRQILERILAVTGRTNRLVPIPPAIARLMALPMALLPNPLLTADRIILLGLDNIVSEKAERDRRTLAAFGIAPTPMDAILPSYLWRFRRKGQFEQVPA